VSTLYRHDAMMFLACQHCRYTVLAALDSRFVADSGVRSLEGLDQISTGFLESLSTAEFRGVRLNKCGIEVVLPDQKAQVVPQPGLTVV
jgi:hypothetical protein